MAPAKINLALHVRRRRADGYHDIETLFAFCADGDAVRVEEATKNRFSIDGPFASALIPSLLQGRGQASNASEGEGQWDPTNLVTKAATAFAKAFDIAQPHAITLTKNLPIASGIGGGSADAAATLRALAKLHKIDSNAAKLIEIATNLGADVPACLHGIAARGTGKGDALDPVAGLENRPALLVNPGVALSTAAVFAGWDGKDRGVLPTGDTLAVAQAARNDLHAPAGRIAPVIDTVLALLDTMGGILARMSGSGATCFALFDDAAMRDRADAAIARAHPSWWRLRTTTA